MLGILLKTDNHFPVERAIELEIAPALDFKFLTKDDRNQLAFVS
jgi:hypothetical protein